MKYNTQSNGEWFLKHGKNEHFLQINNNMHQVMTLSKILPLQTCSDFVLNPAPVVVFPSPVTAALPAAPHGAPDWGQLCPFCSLWQRPAQWREPLIWYFWQRLSWWSLWLLLPAGLQGAYSLLVLCLNCVNRRMCVESLCSMGVLTLYRSWFLQQSNLSNPPTPPASLPPTPPPVNRQKMINGFATTEELASKAAAMGTNIWVCTLMSQLLTKPSVTDIFPTMTHYTITQVVQENGEQTWLFSIVTDKHCVFVQCAHVTFCSCFM